MPKIKCTCECHSREGVTHFQACCNDGWLDLDEMTTTFRGHMTRGELMVREGSLTREALIELYAAEQEQREAASEQVEQ